MCEKSDFFSLVFGVEAETSLFSDLDDSLQVFVVVGIKEGSWHNDLGYGYIGVLCPARTRFPHPSVKNNSWVISSRFKYDLPHWVFRSTPKYMSKQFQFHFKPKITEHQKTGGEQFNVTTPVVSAPSRAGYY